jgi:hypothetical protein
MKNVKVNHPMQTRHGRPSWKAYNIAQLQEALEKNSTPKVKHKIQSEMNRKLNALKA